MNVILDLHKAPGFSFNAFQDATLFENAAQQERFIHLWGSLAGSLPDTRDFVAFELLNEIVLPDSAPWNRLAQKTIDQFDQVDPERILVLGGNYFNSANQLANLNIRPDPNILYTFHFYEPMVVTHQKAKWVPGLLDYNERTDYPGSAPKLGEFLERHPEYQFMLGRYAGKNLDKASLLVDIQPAIDFARRKRNDSILWRIRRYRRSSNGNPDQLEPRSDRHFGRSIILAGRIGRIKAWISVCSIRPGK